MVYGKVVGFNTFSTLYGHISLIKNNNEYFFAFCSIPFLSLLCVSICCLACVIFLFLTSSKYIFIISQSIKKLSQPSCDLQVLQTNMKISFLSYCALEAGGYWSKWQVVEEGREGQLLLCAEECVDMELKPRTVGWWHKRLQWNRFHLKLQKDQVCFYHHFCFWESCSCTIMMKDNVERRKNLIES